MAGTPAGLVVAVGAAGAGLLVAWKFYKKNSSASSGTGGGSSSSAPTYNPPNYPTPSGSGSGIGGSLGASLGGGMANAVPTNSGIFGTPLGLLVNQGNFDLNNANLYSPGLGEVTANGSISSDFLSVNSPSLNADAAGYNNGASWFSNFLDSIGGGWALPDSSGTPDGSLGMGDVSSELTGGGLFNDGNDGLDLNLTGGGDVQDMSGGSVNDYGDGSGGDNGDGIGGDSGGDNGGDNSSTPGGDSESGGTDSPDEPSAADTE